MSSTGNKNIIYDLRLPPGLEGSKLPVVKGVVEAQKQGKTSFVVAGIEAAINIGSQLGIDLYPGKGLGGEVPQS